MTRLPPLRTREVVKGLHTLGFQRVRQTGSHALFHHQDGRRAPVPIHPARPVNPYLLSDILKHLGISEDEFLKAAGKK